MSPPAHHRLLYLLAAVVQGLGLPLVQPFAIRILDEHQWGQVSLSLSLISVGLIALSAGLPQAISSIFFHGASGPAKARSINAFGVLVSIFFAALALLIFGVFWGSGGLFDDNLPYLISIAIIGMHGITQMGLAFLRSDHRAFSFVTITVVATALGHFFGVIAITVLAPTATVYMTAFALAVAAASVLTVVTSKPRHPFRYPRALRGAIRTALPVLPHSIALVLMLQGEPFLVSAFQGVAVAGLYNAVLTLALGALAVVMALSNVWQTTIFAHRGTDPRGEVRAVQHEAVGVGMLLAFGGSGVAVLAAAIIAPGVDDELLRLARLFPLIGYGYIMFLMATTQLFAIARTKIMSVVTPVVAALALLGAAIPARAGDLFLTGAVQVASYLVLGLVYCFLVWRMDRNLLDLGFLLKGLVFALAISLAGLLLPTDLTTSIVTSVLVVVASLAVAVLYLRSLRRREAQRQH
ncbi:hypothetical protein ODZ83_04235 [Acaricomes phytoseiuli]|uniref:lipopolysaccharide biosynthesis protein n=1 Tax=Acaricomes phytoseiuli TaxID=291968 RepID=UPI0022230AC3|nr:hypothetical protein [Acaricomes phytoseiuli]MCW1249402.1 hypothetical protein [Acaricomes phytoseiuli]